MPTDAGTVRVPADQPVTDQSAPERPPGGPAAAPVSPSDPVVTEPEPRHDARDAAARAAARDLAALDAANAAVPRAQRTRRPRPATPDGDPAGERRAGHGDEPAGRGFPVGGLGYALAWAAALVLGGATAAFLTGTPDQGTTLKAAMGAAAVLAAAALHLAALAIGRRRQLGLAVVTIALAAVVVPALAVGLLSAATGWGPAGSLGGPGGATGPATGGVPFTEVPGGELPGGELPGEVLPGGDAGEVLPEVGDPVWCQGPDGSMVEVDPAACADGTVRATPGGAG
ncbi:hypothetical protein [Spirilliplanes yamanashiensis]|nr:hypothetical protein [Spirilliplanes yamanashiensis]MDP9819487.1 hypothetical protein [Spirilliplanes yamanashiensis]